MIEYSSCEPSSAEPVVRLEPLGPRHGEALLAGQDEVLAVECFGRRWESSALAEFLERAAGWAADGPIQEVAAIAATGTLAGSMVGGGGLHLLGAGLERGQADLSYWVLSPHRGRGYGTAIARALAARAGADPRIHELVLRISLGNAPSAALARVLGAHPTGAEERHPADARRSVQRWSLPLPGDPHGPEVDSAPSTLGR